MVTNIRHLVEANLSETLEGGFGLPVVLIAGDTGITYDKSENDDEDLQGQVLFDDIKQNPETGEVIISENPVVVLRRSSLGRVPVSGETWVVKIPESPVDGAQIISYAWDADRAPEGGRSIGFIILYLRKLEQTE